MTDVQLLSLSRRQEEDLQLLLPEPGAQHASILVSKREHPGGQPDPCICGLHSLLPIRAFLVLLFQGS